VWVPLIPAGAIAAFAAVCVVTGAALGADLALPPAMQADVVDLDTLRTGQQRAGLFFALWSMATKLALGIAAAAAFWALDLAGFSPTTDAEETTGLLALTMIYAVVPVVLKGVAMTLVWPFPLDARRQAVIRARLEKRGRIGG
ncbi:MAG: MFS transporter, partial [Caenispirillum bisanense]|nr:MFS transporter [Caenispirillum bisanense]MCA1974206.1 MFS transporter [Caenispirillum sp.]